MIKIDINSEQKCKIEQIYWTWMEKYHLQNLTNIIKADDVLKELILNEDTDLNSAIKKYLLSDYNELSQIKHRIDRLNAEGRCVKECSKDFFEKRYINFRSSQAGKIVQALEITVCPYCNQNHINVVYDKTGTLRYWGDLDHFYNKSTYREMSICLYNLIPACKVCNQLKSDKKNRMSHPYNCEDTSNIVFKTEFDEELDLNYLNGKSQNFNIVVNEGSLSEADKEELEMFDLQNRYSNLKRNAQEIIMKSKAYDEIYRKSLIETFGISEEELQTFMFGYEKNHLNRVLSKFNQDIMEQFLVHRK